MIRGRENSSSNPLIDENVVPIFGSKEIARVFNECFVLHTELTAAKAIPPVIQP